MKRMSAVVAALFLCAICGQVNALDSRSDRRQPQAIDSSTAEQLRYLHDQEKVALDLDWDFLWIWEDAVFQNLGALERRRMDELVALMAEYGLEPSITGTSQGVYGEDDHLTTWREMRDRGETSLLEAYRAVAYMEEWDISVIRALRDGTQEQAVVDASRKMLAGAENHLKMLVSRIKALGHEYEAQLLSQPDVNAICAGVGPYTGTDFTFNAGLNDAWYYPFTSGQGVFVAVYPDSQTLFMSWYTYDTELPGEDAVSHVGDAGQRWLIAQGNYTGNRAELDVFSASGGLLDEVEAVPELEYIGFITLQFEDCSTGSMTYTLWPLWGGYILPLERVASDNVARCELDDQQ